MSTVRGAFRRNSFNVVIANGTSLSAAIDVDDQRPARIQMPGTWDAANLTFQTSIDNVTFANLYDSFGNEYTVQAAASREILLPFVDFVGIRYLKVRSGTSGTPVSQTADRTLLLGTAS
jgi:hypothetical protein